MMKQILIFVVLLIQSTVLSAAVIDVTLDKTQLNYAKGDTLKVNLALFDAGKVRAHAIIRSLYDDTIYLDVISDELGFGVPAGPNHETIMLSTLDYSYFLMHLYNVRQKEISLVVRSYPARNPIGFSSDLKPERVFTKKITLINPKTKEDMFFVKNPSGTWYQPSLSGTGFVVMQYENGTVVQYYGYDADGGRLWLLSDVMDEAWVQGEARTLTMHEGKADSTTGFTKPPASAPGVEQWGTLELQFDSCNKATAKLQGTDGEQAFELQPLAKPSAVHCY